MYVLHPAVDAFQYQSDCYVRSPLGLARISTNAFDSLTELAKEPKTDIPDDDEVLARFVTLGFVVNDSTVDYDDPLTNQLAFLSDHKAGIGQRSLFEKPTSVWFYQDGKLSDQIKMSVEKMGVPMGSGQDLNQADKDSIVVIAPDVPTRESLLKLNEDLHTSGHSFLLVLCNSSSFAIGPYVRPYQSPCIACVLSRRDSNLSEKRTNGVLGGFPLGDIDLPKAEPVSSATAAAAGTFTGVQIQKMMRNLDDLDNSTEILTVNMSVMSMETSKIRRMPRCHVCSDAELRMTLQTI